MSAAITHNNLTVVDSDIHLGVAGAVVWWRLAGGLALPALRSAWRAEGLPEDLLLEQPSAATALRRAVGELRGPALLVRPAPGGGHALVNERPGRDDALEYETLLVVRLDDVGRIVFRTFESDAESLKSKIRADYANHLEECNASDVSQWLVRLMDDLSAVSLRDRGGVYFVPRHAVARWEAMLRAIRPAGRHMLASVPALRSDEAARAVLDAMNEEAARAAATLSEELSNEALGARALQTRADNAASTLSKLGRYEELFGAQLSEAREKLDDIRARIAAAILVAEAKAEEERKAR